MCQQGAHILVGKQFNDVDMVGIRYMVISEAQRGPLFSKRDNTNVQ